MFKALFLRIYASNLRRSWRSDPNSAWWDAVTTMMFLIGFPALTLVFDLWVLALDLFPRSIGALGMSKNAGFAVIVASGITLLFIITRLMRSYKEEPAVRNSYNTPADRWKIAAAIAVSIGMIVAMNAITAIMHETLRAH